MKVVTVVDVRRDLDRVLDDLESTSEPIIVEDGGSVRTVLISVDDFERELRAPSSGPVDTVQLLRGLRGYHPA